jgi:hypothetical protein
VDHPEKLQELIDLWWTEAGRLQALPLESRSALEILGAERPQLSKPRSQYVYRPGGAEIPESVAPNIRNRSFTIAAEVEIDDPSVGGVLFSQGSRFGGHALYVKDGKLKYVYNFVGEAVQVVESDEPVPTGHSHLSASFEKRGDGMPTKGTLTLPYTLSGTATLNIDYTLSGTPGQITFAPNTTTALVTVTAIKDGIREKDETIIMTIPTSTNGTGTTSTKITIHNKN